MKSKLMEEIVLAFATYVREFIKGNDNAVGHNSYFHKKTGWNSYIIDGKNVDVYELNEKDFLDVVDITKRFVLKEKGPIKLDPRDLDLYIAEMLFMLRFDSFSIDNLMSFVTESSVRLDPAYEEASEAMKRLYDQGPINEYLTKSEIPNFSTVILKGKYESLKREQYDLIYERGKDASRFTRDQQRALDQVTREMDAVKRKIAQSHASGTAPGGT